MYILRFVTFEIQFAERHVFKRIQNIRRIVQHVFYENYLSEYTYPNSFSFYFFFFRLKKDDLNLYNGLKKFLLKLFSSDFLNIINCICSRLCRFILKAHDAKTASFFLFLISTKIKYVNYFLKTICYNQNVIYYTRLFLNLKFENKTILRRSLSQIFKTNLFKATGSLPWSVVTFKTV